MLSSSVIVEPITKKILDLRSKIAGFIEDKKEVKDINKSLEDTRRSLSKSASKVYNYKFKYIIFILAILASFTVAKLVRYIEIEYKTIMFYRHAKQGKITKVTPEMLSRITRHITIAARIYKAVSKLKAYVKRAKEWRVSKKGLEKFDEVYLEMESLYDIVEKKDKK